MSFSCLPSAWVLWANLVTGSLELQHHGDWGIWDVLGLAIQKVLRHSPFLWPLGALGTQPKPAWLKEEKVVLLENLGMVGHHKTTQEEQWKCFRFLDLKQNSIIKLFHALSLFSQKCVFMFVVQSGRRSCRWVHVTKESRNCIQIQTMLIPLWI